MKSEREGLFQHVSSLHGHGAWGERDCLNQNMAFIGHLYNRLNSKMWANGTLLNESIRLFKLKDLYSAFRLLVN